MSAPAGCPRCGQDTLEGDGTVCDACRAGEREAQGEQVGLFAPAPAQMDGQGWLL